MGDFLLHLQDNTKPLKPYWNLCVGSCHATTALREDYRKQLARCQRDLGFRYVRFHGLFDDDMSVLTKTHKAGDKSDTYTISFTNIDSIYDFLLSIHMKPFIELGFMPECLRTKDTTVFHYKGNTSRPSSYEVWDWLIETFAEHLIARYGRDEVRQWFFEVWNEPNLGGPDSPHGFWSDTMEEYFNLYEHTARTLKRVDHRLRVGGPATSNNAWIPEFTEFCRKNDVPVDFISTHHYPTDVILGYGVEDSLNFFSPKAGETQEEFEQRQEEWFRNLWVHVDRGVLTQMTKKAVREAQGLPVYYTEWNSLAGLPSDGPFGASFILKTIMDGAGLTEGYSYWTFTDIFEEGGMPSKAFHGGFGLLTLQGIPKAAYRAFELLARLGDEVYEHSFSEGTVDVYAVKKKESTSIQFLAVNHHSLLHDIREETVTITLEGLPGEGKAEIERLDETHGNALRVWKEMGEPEYLNQSQIAALESASYTYTEPLALEQDAGCVSFDLTLPPMGAALISIYY
ncbi:MAG: beta-xylosidase [Clostridiales bacterium]|nr:beta-xylosidase [Clostridiales bacterium]